MSIEIVEMGQESAKVRYQNMELELRSLGQPEPDYSCLAERFMQHSLVGEAGQVQIGFFGQAGDPEANPPIDPAWRVESNLPTDGVYFATKPLALAHHLQRLAQLQA